MIFVMGIKDIQAERVKMWDIIQTDQSETRLKAELKYITQESLDPALFTASFLIFGPSYKVDKILVVFPQTEQVEWSMCLTDRADDYYIFFE